MNTQVAPIDFDDDVATAYEKPKNPIDPWTLPVREQLNLIFDWILSDENGEGEAVLAGLRDVAKAKLYQMAAQKRLANFVILDPEDGLHGNAPDASLDAVKQLFGHSSVAVTQEFATWREGLGA